jgi:DNA repair exonuclease SbcCD ATPase subunit
MNSKIVALDVENVKKVSAVHIEPNGSMVVIGGENGAGKSSVLDSIAYALGGKTLLPKRPIKDGAEKATIRVNLGELIVERTFTQAGSYLTVKNPDGFAASSPQAILDALVGKLTFDPLAFATQQQAERAELLRSLAGLDFSKLDEERDLVVAERRDLNRNVKNLKATLDSMPLEEAPASPVSVSALMEELKQRESINAANARDREELDAQRRLVTAIKKDKEVIVSQIESLQNDLAELEEAIKVQIEQGKTKAKRVEKLQDLDVDEIRQQISDADEINSKVRQNEKRAATEAAYSEAKADADKMTHRLQEIEKQKAQAISAAEFPIDGLSIADNDVLFNGIPFDQISQAEKLRVSVAMGLHMNPKLRVMLIRDGSLLDETNLQLVQDLADQNDAQIWIERVGNGPEVSVLIEDGTISVPEEVLL